MVGIGIKFRKSAYWGNEMDSSFSWCSARRVWDSWALLGQPPVSAACSWAAAVGFVRQPVPQLGEIRDQALQKLPSEWGILFPSRRWIAFLPPLLSFPSLLLVRLLDAQLWLTKAAEADTEAGNFFCYLRVVFLFFPLCCTILMCPIVKYHTVQVQGGISCMEEGTGEEWLSLAAVRAVSRLTGCLYLGNCTLTQGNIWNISLWLQLNITSFEKSGLGISLEPFKNFVTILPVL